MKNVFDKVISIFLILFSIWMGIEILHPQDPNLDCARKVLCEQALFYGDINTFERQNSKIRDPEYKFIEFKFIELKRKIQFEKIIPSEIENQILKLPKKEHQFLLYSLLACKSYDEKNPTIFLKYMNVSLFIAWDNRYSIRFENNIIEVIDKLLAFDSKLPQEYAVNLILKLQRYSNDKALRFYTIGGKKYARLKMQEFAKKEDFKKKYHHLDNYINKYPTMANIKNEKTLFIEKRFTHSAWEFLINWNIKKSNDYKLPIIAYIYYCSNDKIRYELYRRKSTSLEQIKNMKAGEFRYVEYASKIFSLTEDYDSAIKLIKTLPISKRKNIVLKHTIRYLTATELGYRKVVESAIFD